MKAWSLIFLCFFLPAGWSRASAGQGGPDPANPVLVDADIYDVDGSDLITVIDPPFEDDTLVGYWIAVRRYIDLPIQFYRIVSNKHFDQWNISVFSVAEDLEGGGTPWWYFYESSCFSILAPLCDPEITISSVQRLPDDTLALQLGGASDGACIVQCSTDLIEWQTVATAEIEDGQVIFDDPLPISGAFCVYRIMMP